MNGVHGAYGHTAGDAVGGRGSPELLSVAASRRGATRAALGRLWKPVLLVPLTKGPPMPTIIIQADGANGQPAPVTLVERVVPADAHSEHYLAQLVERVGWALLDAEELEQH